MVRKRLRLTCLILVFVLLLGAAAPSSAATISARFERTLGSGTAPALIKEYGGEYIPPIQQRLWLEEVFARLTACVGREDVEYTLTVLNSREANAFSLPGGYVFITRGLLNLIGGDEAQLAAVLGHEIAHVEKKHGVNAVLRQMGLTVLAEVGALALDFISGELVRLAGATLVQVLQLGWGREAEFEADAVGQSLAVQAGFDPIGAIGLLDRLAQVNSSEEPVHLFSTHPDVQQRRQRLETALGSFWSEPVVVGDSKVLERLNQGRNSDQSGRTDPKGRYMLELSGQPGGLRVFDEQNREYVTWVPQASVREAAWSPQGDYLALLVEAEAGGEVWITDRWGYVVEQLKVQGDVAAFCWSPHGRALALDVVGPGEKRVMAAYLGEKAYVEVSRGLTAQGSCWLDDGLYFLHNGRWYQTQPPEVVQVRIDHPVPVVLQRKRVLNPTLIKEGNTYRLTRPALTLP